MAIIYRSNLPPRDRWHLKKSEKNNFERQKKTVPHININSENMVRHNAGDEYY